VTWSKRSAVVTPPSSGEWRRALVLTAVVLCHVALVWSARNPGLLTGQDDAEYILMGRALSQGSYREVWRVDAPIHSQYPPGYPALLGFWEAAGGNSYRARVALMTAISAATLLLLHSTLRRRFGGAVAMATVVVLAVNPYVVQYAGELASETPYTFFSVLCLYCLVRSDESRHLGVARSATAWLTAAGAAAVIATMTRTVGIALVGMLWLSMVFLQQRSKAVLLFTLACVATTGGWLLWTILAPEQFVGRSYIADVMRDVGPLTLLRRVGAHVWSYAVESLPWALAFPTIQGTVIDNVAGLLVVALTLMAGIYVFLRRWREAALYLLTYASVLAIFRWHLTRFLVPALALLVPCVFVGAEWIAGRLRPSWSRGGLIVLTLAMVWGGAERSRELVVDRSCHRSEDIPLAECTTPEQAGYFDALRYVRTGLPENATFLTAKSGALYYYTGRKSISVEAARGQSPEDFIPFVRSQGADYVLLASVDSLELKYFGPLLQANCERLQLIKSFTPATLLFAVNPARFSATGERDACEAIAEYRARNSGRDL